MVAEPNVCASLCRKSVSRETILSSCFIFHSNCIEATHNSRLIVLQFISAMDVSLGHATSLYGRTPHGRGGGRANTPPAECRIRLWSFFCWTCFLFFKIVPIWDHFFSKVGAPSPHKWIRQDLSLNSGGGGLPRGGGVGTFGFWKNVE